MVVPGQHVMGRHVKECTVMGTSVFLSKFIVCSPIRKSVGAKPVRLACMPQGRRAVTCLLAVDAGMCVICASACVCVFRACMCALCSLCLPLCDVPACLSSLRMCHVCRASSCVQDRCKQPLALAPHLAAACGRVCLPPCTPLFVCTLYVQGQVKQQRALVSQLEAKNRQLEGSLADATRDLRLRDADLKLLVEQKEQKVGRCGWVCAYVQMCACVCERVCIQACRHAGTQAGCVYM